MKDPHQNIFFYYRGPSSLKVVSLYDFQVEDNTTKSLINILEFCEKAGFEKLTRALLAAIRAPKRRVIDFKLQRGLEDSRPDGLIDLGTCEIHIESKVRARLYLEQIKRHLASIGSQDILLVVTNIKEHAAELERIKDGRIRHLQWAELNRICLQLVKEIRQEKKSAAIEQLIKHFIDYLEVVVMTEFNGFKNEDFDFWLDPNPYYVPILRKKLEALAGIIKDKLPKAIRAYNFVQVGYVSKSGKDERSAWVAIKKPKNEKDVFNQCNFTIEVSKNGLEINAVIRNGRTEQSQKPIGVFFDKLSRDPKGFLNAIGALRKEARIVIAKRLPRVGKQIMPGNEQWNKFFDMKLSDITNAQDILYLRSVLQKADRKPGAPGIHFRYSIGRGEKILTEPEELTVEIINTMESFYPILSFLENE